jgi:hypothetical protein
VCFSLLTNETIDASGLFFTFLHANVFVPLERGVFVLSQKWVYLEGRDTWFRKIHGRQFYSYLAPLLLVKICFSFQCFTGSKIKAECESALRQRSQTIDSDRRLGGLRLDCFLISFRSKLLCHGFLEFLRVYTVAFGGVR